MGRKRPHTSEDSSTEARMSEPQQTRPIAISPAEAARLVGLGKTKLYEVMGTGELPFLKIGTRRLIRVTDLEAWIERQSGIAQSERSAA